MYNNIGLQSVRGTGTSGFVQKNLAAVPKNRQNMSWEASLEREEKLAQRKPVQYVADPEILDHERKKKVEIAVLEWAEAAGILDSDMPQEEQDRRMAQKRVELEEQFARRGPPKRLETSAPRSSHQERHAKEQHQARLAGALGIREDYREGQAFDEDWQMKEREERAQKREEMHRLKIEEQSLMRQLEEKRRQERAAAGAGASSSYNQDDHQPRRGADSERYGSNAPSDSSLRRRDSPSPPRRRRDYEESDYRRGRDEGTTRGRQSPRRRDSPSPPRRRRDSPSPPRRRSPPSSPAHRAAETSDRLHSPAEREISEEHAPPSPEYRPATSSTESATQQEDLKASGAPGASSMDVDQKTSESTTAHTDSPVKATIDKKADSDVALGDSSASVEATEENAQEEPASPRKRGRGKKATAAKKSAAAASPEKSEEAQTTKKATAKATAKRGRGKKATAAVEEVSDTKEEEQMDVDASKEEDVEPEPVAKKAKRGRAKKAAAESDDDLDSSPPAKRAKRGGK
jgi:serine/arginine repetitive matrix protein 2